MYPHFFYSINKSAPQRALARYGAQKRIDCMETLNRYERFKRYVATVEEAAIMAKGSGELNLLDHHANDIWEEGFLEEMELTPLIIKRYYREWYRQEVFEEAMKKYGNC